MARETVSLQSLLGAERVESHGKRYALAPYPGGGVRVFRLDGEDATQFGGAADRNAALALVDDDATGRAQARAERFHRWLGETIDSVRPGVSGPMLAAGYEAWHTGGGCMAWRRELPDGGHLLVTAGDDGLDADPAEAAWCVGRYGAEEGFAFVHARMTLADAIAAGPRLPAPVGRDGEAAELTYETLADAEAGILADPGGPAP